MSNYKKYFPFFSHAQRAATAYLDNAATTHKAAKVIKAINQFYEQDYATVHRGLYEASEWATQAYESSREIVSQFINSTGGHEIVFTKGTTESINCFAHSWALRNLTNNDEIVITQAEHHANLIPWQRIARLTGAKIIFIPLDKTNFLLSSPSDYISSRTKLLTVAHHSNVLGSIWQKDDLEKTIAKARKEGATIFFDMAQCAAHHPIDIQKLDADVIAFSGHKMFGPTGVGVLYINEQLHGQLQPYQLGGAAVESVSWEKATLKPMPHMLESGTPPIAQVIGLTKAIEFIKQVINFNELKQYEAYLCSRLINGLKQHKEVLIFGNLSLMQEEGHLVCFTIKGIHAHDFAALCASKNISLRAGHHCAQPLVSDILKQQSVIRASVSIYNSENDIDQLLATVQEAITLFSHENRG